MVEEVFCSQHEKSRQKQWNGLNTRKETFHRRKSWIWPQSSNWVIPTISFFNLTFLFRMFPYFSSFSCHFLKGFQFRLQPLYSKEKLVFDPFTWKIFIQRPLRESHKRTASGDLGSDQPLWFPRENHHNKVHKVKAPFYTEQEIANFDFLVGSPRGHQDSFLHALPVTTDSSTMWKKKKSLEYCCKVSVDKFKNLMKWLINWL